MPKQEVQLFVTKKVGFGRNGELVGSPDARAVHMIRRAIEHAQKLTPAEIDEWADGAMAIALKELGRTAEEMKVNEVLWVAPVGCQGAGKGTQIKALTEMASQANEYFEQVLANGERLNEKIPPELSKLIGQWANAGNIVTGTGGMMRNPEGEYALLFKGIEVIAKKYSDIGELVPAKFTGVMVTLMTALRLAQGKTTIVGDLFPRDGKQKEILDQMAYALRSKGIKVDLTIIDFKMMSESTVQRINGNKERSAEMKKWADSSVTIGKMLKGLVPYLKDLKDGSSAVSIVTGILKAYALVSPEFKAMAGEVVMAMKRVDARVVKAGEGKRSDDTLPHVLINRLASYFIETWPPMLGFKEAIAVSAAPSEDVVFDNFVMALLKSPRLAIDPCVRGFIRDGQKRAKKIVEEM